MHALSALALRRTLPPWLFVGLVVLLVMAARGAAHGAAHGPGAALDERALAGLRALERQQVWSVLLAVAPLLLWEAARLGRPRASAWLAPTPAAPLVPALATLAGCALATLAATLVTAVVAEAATPDAPAAWRRARVEASPAQVLFDDAPRARWRIPALAPGERLRLWTGVAPGAGPAVSARFTARAGEGSAAVSAEVSARVSGRTALELVPPPAAGELELELERVEAGALLVLPAEALEVLAPVASERLAAVHLGSRVLLALVTGCALALGLGRHLRPGLAAGTVLALFLGAVQFSGHFSGHFSGARPWLAPWLPGADLPAAWRALEHGLVPAPVAGRAWLGALALAALGLALLARRAPQAEGDE
jgi:hypothetical protein